MFPFLSAITALFVFFILQKGWKESNDYIKAYFLLFTILTSLAGAYPEVYKQAESIELHKKSYIKYKNLQKSVFNYALTAPYFEKDTVIYSKFIDQINTEEKKLNTLIFNIHKKSLDEGMFNLGVK